MEASSINFVISQPLSGDRRYRLSEPSAVIIGTLVEPESLFVEIPVKMNRINADVGSLEGAFQEAPKVLNIVRMDVIAHELDRVINGFMGGRHRKARDGI